MACVYQTEPTENNFLIYCTPSIIDYVFEDLEAKLKALQEGNRE